MRATKAILLARVSSEEQAQESHSSIPAQLRNMREYAKRNKISITKEFQFVESAYCGNRLEFRAAFNKGVKIAENNGEPIAILVDEVTRFARNLKDVVKADDLRREGKLELHFVSQNLVIHKNSTAYEVGNWEQLAVMGKMQSGFTSEKVKSTFRYKLEHRQYPGYVPTGYLNSTINGKKENVPDPERANLIREAFELYASNNFSVQELTQLMRQKGLTIRAKKGNTPKPVSKSDMVWILNNIFYTGRFRWLNPVTREHEIYQGNYEALISEELFNKVKKILNEKAIRFSTRHSATKFFKFRGLVRCGFCGCLLTPNDLSTNYKDKKPGEEVYYRCTCSKKANDPDYYKRKFGTKNCPQMYWREEEIEHQIKDAFDIMHYDESIFKELRETLNEKFQTQIKLSQAQKHSLEIDLRKEEKLRDAFLEKMVLSDYAEFKLDMKERLIKVKKEIESIKEKIEVFEEAEDVKTDEFVDTLVLCSNLKNQYEKLSAMKKRELIILAFKDIVAFRGKRKAVGKEVKLDGLSFVWNEPFETLFSVGIEEFAKQIKGKTPKLSLNPYLNNTKDSV